MKKPTELTRGRPSGQPKSGGRQVGTKNKVQVTEQMRADILACYTAMGGVAFLLDWAQKNQTEFIKLCWSRIAPPLPRDEPEQLATVVNVNNLTELEAARRIAFALTKGAKMLEAQRTVSTIDPRPSHELVLPPLDEAPVDPAYAHWAAGLTLTDEQRLVQQTHDANIENYVGSSAEQSLKRDLL